MNIKICDADWGGIDLCIDFNKIEILPRFNISSMHDTCFVNIGFLMLTFGLYIYGAEMRDFTRRMRSGELDKQFQEHIKLMDEQIKHEQEQYQQEAQQQQDTIKHISEVVDQIMLELKKKPRYKKRVAEQ